MQTNKHMVMTQDDLRLLHEAVTLLLVVKRAARAERDAKLVEALGEKLFGEEGQDGESKIATGV
jgi:hypothetical protein